MGCLNRFNWIRKLSRWYFSKRVLPYWCILLGDAFIVFVSCIFTYWVNNRTGLTFENRNILLITAALYAVLSWVGARIFKTYSGVVRYSSFIDLIKLAYANLVTMVLALAVSLIARWQGIEMLSALTPLETVAAITVATFFMWVMRVVVKTLFDVTSADGQAKRVLIYGAITGGIGVAKSIRSQQPAQFELRGFITHEKRIKDMRLMYEGDLRFLRQFREDVKEG